MLPAALLLFQLMQLPGGCKKSIMGINGPQYRLRRWAVMATTTTMTTKREGGYLIDPNYEYFYDYEDDKLLNHDREQQQQHHHHHHHREPQQQQQQGGDGELLIEDECHLLYHLLSFTSDYYIPLLIILGLLGNLLSGLVFLSGQLRVRSSSYYLAALALADSGFLCALLLVWLDTNLGWRTFNASGWCEATVYASSVCGSLSVWLIVSFTVERFVAIQYPLHRPRVCTASRSKCIVLVLFLVAMASHSYAFLAAGLVEYPDGGVWCDMKMEYFQPMRLVSLVDCVLSLICPLVLIVAMNVCIWRNLLRFGRLFEQQQQLQQSTSLFSSKRSNNSNDDANNATAMSTFFSGEKGPRQSASRSSSQFQFSQSNINNCQSISGSSSTRKPVVYHISRTVTTSSTTHIGSSSRNLMSTRNQQNITKMLLLISTVFIILNLPSYVMRLCVFFFTLARKDTPTLIYCFQQFFMVLYYTNFSINFLLYAMCGVTFRRCLRQLLSKVLKRIKKYYCFSQQ